MGKGDWGLFFCKEVNTVHMSDCCGDVVFIPLLSRKIDFLVNFEMPFFVVEFYSHHIF